MKDEILKTYIVEDEEDLALSLRRCCQRSSSAGLSEERGAWRSEQGL